MNISDLYSTRIQKSFDEDQADIIAILKSAPPKTVLRLINYFKGMPVSYSATINTIEKHTIDLDLQGEQAFTVEESRSVFIRSPLFKYDVFATAQYVNIKKRAATFTKLFYVEIVAEQRNFIRIKPEPAPVAIIETPQGTIEGQLYDISLTGLNISLENYCQIERGTETKIKSTFGNIEQDITINLNVTAKLVAIKDQSRPYSYVFTFSLDKELERQLSQYVFKRQIEIIREIKDAVC
jgi:hypothetical protein